MLYGLLLHRTGTLPFVLKWLAYTSRNIAGETAIVLGGGGKNLHIDLKSDYASSSSRYDPSAWSGNYIQW